MGRWMDRIISQTGGFQECQKICISFPFPVTHMTTEPDPTGLKFES